MEGTNNGSHGVMPQRDFPLVFYGSEMVGGVVVGGRWW